MNGFKYVGLYQKFGAKWWDRKKTARLLKMLIWWYWWQIVVNVILVKLVYHWVVSLNHLIGVGFQGSFQ